MPTQPDKTIEALLLEKRQFPPPKKFSEQANVRDPSVYRKADRDFEKFWAGFARELSWYKPWKRVLDWKPPKAKWFVGGKLNASVNCLDRHVAGLEAHLGGGAGRPTDPDVPGAPPGGREVRKRPEVSRHPQGRSRHALHADDSGASHRDARLRADRSDPLRRVRRFLGGVPEGSDQRSGREGARHRRRRLAPRQRRAAEEDLG